MFRITAFTITVICMFFVFCSDPDISNPEKGQLKIYIQDNPADYDSVMITIDTIGSRPTNNNSGNLTALFTNSETFDFMTLRNGNRRRLTSNELPAGSIGSVRIVFGQCRVVIDRISYNLYFSPPACSIMEVPGRVFFNEDKDGLALIDINLLTSISYDSVNTRYIFEPDITLLDIESTGSIYGTILPRADIYLYDSNGNTIAFTYASGHFGFYGLTQEHYSLMWAPIGADTSLCDTLWNGPYPIYPGVEYDLGDLDLYP